MSLQKVLIATVSITSFVLFVIIFASSSDIKKDVKLEEQKIRREKQEQQERINNNEEISDSSTSTVLTRIKPTTTTKKPSSKKNESTNSHNNINKPKHKIGPNPSKPFKGTVAICVFGLVKNIKPQHLETYIKHLYQQFWYNGYVTVTLMHTYRMN